MAKAVPTLPKSALYKALRTKKIKRNGKRCECSDRLCEGDVLTLWLNDDFFPSAPTELDFLSVPGEISVLYEDENILLADKRAGLLVHEDDTGVRDTLINRIKRYLYDRGEYDPAREQSFAPALCNRIDRNTSGIVIAAKNAESLRILNEKLRTRELKKEYLCAVTGTLPKKEGLLTGYLEKNCDKNKVFISDAPIPGGKTIKTRYRVLREENGLSLLLVGLETGRTHQIRAQFAHEGHPLLGDGKYGSCELNRRFGAKYQALCSFRLTFDLPTDAGCLNYLKGRTFQTPLPWFAEELFGGNLPL